MKIEFAKEAFKDYIKQYDLDNYKIKQKIIHTYNVVKMSKYLSEKLNLDQTQANLAELIGLLHDIGRFEQLKKYNSTEDYNTIDHAIYGAKILFEDNLIRKFIKENKYDEIIYKAIINHNKLEVDETGLDLETLMQIKIIRDSDKIDNFRVQAEGNPAKLLLTEPDKLEKEEITDDVYNRLINKKVVIYDKRKTHLDKWVSVVGFIYDFYFNESLKYIHKNGYLHKAIYNINYKNEDTIKKINEIEKVANNYIINTLEKDEG